MPNTLESYIRKPAAHLITSCYKCISLLLTFRPRTLHPAPHTLHPHAPYGQVQRGAGPQALVIQVPAVRPGQDGGEHAPRGRRRHAHLPEERPRTRG